MTDHTQLSMAHEDRRITDPSLIRAILDSTYVCTLCLHDGPYPYPVPMNFGYTWDEQLTLYLHMAAKGHRLELIRQDPRVACNIYSFLDRRGHKSYRGETHDYRSVTVFGRAQVIPRADEAASLAGMNVMVRHSGRPALRKMPATDNLLILKVTPEIITAKAQYPLTPQEAQMPALD